MKISNYTKGLSSITISAFCFSLAGTLGFLIFKGGANPLTLLTGRFFMAGILFFITILFWDRKLFRVARADIGQFLLLGAILFGHLMTYWYGFQIIKMVSIQIGIFFLYPLWIAIFTALFARKKISKRVFLCIGVGLLGILLVLGLIPNFVSSISLAGVLLVLATGIFWALYYIFSQKMIKKYHPFTLLFYNFIFVVLASCLFQSPAVSLAQMNPNIVWYMLAIGFFTTYLSYLFLYYAIRLNTAVVASIQNMISPVFAILLAIIALGQGITILQGLGIGIILFNIKLLKNG